MYYSVKPLSDDQGVIAVASAQYITDALIRSINANIVVMVLGLVLFLLLSITLASYATRPLRKAWEAQQRFISDVSHELKTPLAVIKANMSIMSAHRSDSFQENERWITSTQDVVERMNSLVEDMLQLSRHRKRSSHEYIICNLGELAEKSALQFESRAFEQGITIKTYIDKSIGIKGDEAELLRLITIFVDNACKYAYTNTEVSLTVKRISSQKALVSIHNMGAPIPERDLPHIFERFYRVNKERERESGSWGLGLPIAQNIITAYKGNIIVSSDTEDGTTFTLYLPTFDL
ncbi:MAG: HAMP domain-containing histidine kinase, partial [Eggerthellaceae bacterium]|nr:HAMP domain-containing histidine kinase [Eggerthellaceae bacterium]